MNLPKDPMILLSFVNTKLRDEFTDLEEFCKEEDISIESLKEQLESIGFQYNETIRQFKYGVDYALFSTKSSFRLGFRFRRKFGKY